MAKMTYKEQLLHPNWQRKRLEIMERDKFCCCLCGDDERTLHVHHKQYAKGRLAWEYPNDELVTLCEVCHETMHAMTDRMRHVVAKLPVDGPGNLESAVAVLAGWAHLQQHMVFDDFIGDEPFQWFAGRAAQGLADKLRIDGLTEFADAVIDCPPWVLRDELSKCSQAIRQRFDEPPPPGYGEPAL